MRKQLLLAALGLAALLPFSCTHEWEDDAALQVKPGDRLTIVASTEAASATKTKFVDNPRGVLWKPGDKISLFFGAGTDGGSEFTATNTEESKVATFSGVITAVTLGSSDESAVASHSFTGVYPYRNDNACEVTEDGILVTATLPDEQQFLAGTFDNNTFITMGSNRGLDIAFKSVCSGVTFTVSRDDITSITLEGRNGEILAGRVKIGYQNDVPVVKQVVDGKTSVTLSAPGGMTFRPGVKYYITTLPASLPNGIKMTFRTQYETGVRTWTTAKTFSRNLFTNWNNIDAGGNASFSTGVLPRGNEFRLMLDTEISNSTITEVRFVPEQDDSDTQGAVLMNAGLGGAPVYYTMNNGVVEISTTAAGFTADTICDGMFLGFEAMETISGLEYVDTRNVTSMQGMFWSCQSVANLDLKSFNTSSVTNMASMFEDCIAVENITLSSFNTASVTDFSRMFFGTSTVQSIVFGDAFVLDPAGDADFTNMFGDPANAYYMTGGGNWPEPRTDFFCTSALETSLRTILGSEASHYGFCSLASTMAQLPSGTAFNSSLTGAGMAPSLKDITEIRFVANSSVTGVVLNTGINPVYGNYHDGVVEITTSTPGFSANADCHDMFYNLQHLRKIEGLNLLDTRNVTYLRRMFGFLPMLEELDLSSFNTSNVDNFSDFINWSPVLEKLVLGDGFVIDPAATTTRMFGDPNTAGTMMGSSNSPVRTVIMAPHGVLAGVVASMPNAEQQSYKFVDLSSTTAQLPSRTFLFNNNLDPFPQASAVSEILFVTNCTDAAGYIINNDVYTPSGMTWNISQPLYASYQDGVMVLATPASSFTVVSGGELFAGFSSLSSLNLGSDFVIDANASTTNMFGNPNSPGTMMGSSNTPDPRTFIYGPQTALESVRTILDTEADHYKCIDVLSTAGRLPAGARFKDRIIALAPSQDDITEVRFVAGSNQTGTLINYDNYDLPVYASYSNGVVQVFTSSSTFILVGTNFRFLYNFQYLTTITGLTSFDTSRAASMQEMFANNPRLTALDLSSFDTRNLGSSGFKNFLSGTSRLSTLVLGSNFDMTNYSNDMFGTMTTPSTTMGYANGTPRTTITCSDSQRRFIGNTVIPGYYSNYAFNVQ